jgi:hypothetical protein
MVGTLQKFKGVTAWPGKVPGVAIHFQSSVQLLMWPCPLEKSRLGVALWLLPTESAPEQVALISDAPTTRTTRSDRVS